MTDIVERLRAWHSPGEVTTGDVQLYLDAATEIERLRAALEGILMEWDMLARYGSPMAKAANERVTAARRALENKP